MYAKTKLLEAKFFWEKFRQSKNHTNEYVFYFSAFSSSFRSITFAIQSQYKRFDGYQIIYDEVLEFFKGLQLSKDLVETRNISLKEGSKVPIMVTISRNNETGDSFRFEADPVPIDLDALRKTEVFFAVNSMAEVSLDYDEKTKKEIYMSQLHFALKRMSKSKNVTTEYYLKLHEDGHEIPIDALDKEVGLALEFLGGVIERFELLIPKNEWDNFNQQRA